MVRAMGDENLTHFRIESAIAEPTLTAIVGLHNILSLFYWQFISWWHLPGVNWALVLH